MVISVSIRGFLMMKNILKSLLKPEAYPEPAGSIELVQTHVSYIFLTDRYAYKIKKPVDFGFLNFSTIDRRRFYCSEEVRLNRRLCPDMYEGVTELRETASGAAFHGNGQILDYAVKMKRLPADRMLDRLVDTQLITSADMKNISRVIADFHRSAATSPNISEYGRIERIMYNWQENFDQCLAFEDTTLPAPDRELIRSWVSAFIEENRPLFEQRHDDGFIRECDGDIHLENICLVDDSVYIFDCIEFNERFRCCDTAADIAFLLMDLDFHRRHDLSGEVITEYVRSSGDSGATGLIDFYKVYRAFVRGKVESLRMKDADIDAAERAQAGLRAECYFRLACGYIQRLWLKPALFITCGVMGTGKSTLARQLSFELGISSHSSDTVRKRSAGLPAEAPVRDEFGAGLYSSRITDDTYAELFRRAAGELSQGRSVIVDASFIRRRHRDQFAALAHGSEVPLIILQLTCGEAEQRRRLSDREASGASVSDGRPGLLEQQSAAFEPPDVTEGMLVTLSSAASPSAMTRELFARLGPPC